MANEIAGYRRYVDALRAARPCWTGVLPILSDVQTGAEAARVAVRLIDVSTSK
jgi:hypothetical protein